MMTWSMVWCIAELLSPCRFCASEEVSILALALPSPASMTGEREPCWPESHQWSLDLTFLLEKFT